MITERSLPPPVRWLERAAAAQGSAPALAAGGEPLTYAALARRVAGVAGTLRRMGAGGGGLAVAGGPRLLTALLAHATPRVGARLIPVNPDLPAHLLVPLLQAAGATALVAERPLGGLSPIEPERLLRAAEEEPAPMADDGLTADAVHLVLATSGSSGPPKAVPLTGANLAAAVAASRAVLPLAPGDCWLGCLPLFHIGGLSVLYRAAEAGAAVSLHERFDAEAVWAEVAAGGVTHLSLVPAMLARLLEAAGGHAPPARLRGVLVGGASLPPALAQRAVSAGWPICASYGMTEAGSQVATRCRIGMHWEAGAVGRPLPGFELTLLEPSAGVGRIAVRGPAVMAGYAGVGPEANGLREGWYITGDVGRIGPEGELTVLGRADEVIVTGGENVHPVLVEAELARCPGVEEVGVTACADPVWGQLVVAVVVGSAEPEAVEAWARAHLPSPWRPRRLLRVATLPRGATGKIDRAALSALLAD